MGSVVVINFLLCRASLVVVSLSPFRRRHDDAVCQCVCVWAKGCVV